MAAVGDFNGDEVVDLAVGAYRQDDGGSDRGCVYLLMLQTNGMVLSHQRVSDLKGGLTATFAD